MINIGARVGRLPRYAVGKIAERKRELLAAGVDVIDLGAGDADFAPPQVAVERLADAVGDPRNSRYAFQLGAIEFRQAVQNFMSRRFGVEVDEMTEILPLIGSKEGLAHLPFAVLDPGDVCVVPEPGYPAYTGGSILAGADIEVFPLRADTGFLVELEELPKSRLEKTKLAYLNYPNNPTAAIAPREYLERTLAVCHEHGILLAYDNAYSELTFDGYRAPSILEFPGARDVAVEFHSLSKSFGMTGWRLGWAVGNSTVIEALSKVKAYTDTGAFLAVQQAGAAVLDEAEQLVQPVVAEFQRRRDALVGALTNGGLACSTPAATMYLWVPLPERVTSAPFAQELLEGAGVAVLAGSFLGAAGEGFVRLSFVVGPDRLREAAGRILDMLSSFAKLEGHA